MEDEQPALVSASPPPRPRRRVARRIAFWLFLLLILAAGLGWAALTPARAAGDAWRARRVSEAIEKASWWSWMPLWPNQYHQVLAASYLSVGNPAAAQRHLDAIRGKRLLVNIISKDELASRLFARARYDDFLVYDAASRPMFGADEAQLYRAAAFIYGGRVADAEATLRSVDRDDVDAGKLARIQSALAQRKLGSYPSLLDRNGRTIAMYEMNNRDVVAVNTDFAPLVDKEAGAMTIESHIADFGANDVIETTLDPAVQKAALAALGGFRGSLVAIDPRTNELLAIASNRGGGPMANLALEFQYEPGSVVKVLTELNAVASGVNATFPYQCNGELDIDGQRFGDWLPGGHGTLADLDDALAESCNLVFADLGMRLGAVSLRAFMQSAGYDGETDIGLYKVPLGRTVGPIINRYETANYAIGLEHETTTTLHLAMLAAAMANRGVMTTPRLVRARRSILDDAPPPAQASRQLVTREVAERVIRSMVAVTTRERGTGRRAAPEGVTLAMKTGTAGTREGGYNSVIMAFTPVDSPRIAFALMAEDAGPAEYAGAKITNDFLQAVK
jgi:peptidoglycan glycosyltransferase